jgi:hypothetical protein
VRTQAERDEQTVDIVAAILVAGLIWGVLLILLAVPAGVLGADEVLPVLAVAAAVGFVVTVVRRLL